jgi:hypothetical protein
MGSKIEKNDKKYEISLFKNTVFGQFLSLDSSAFKKFFVIRVEQMISSPSMYGLYGIQVDPDMLHA